MDAHILRERDGSIIGRISTDSTGKQWLHDKNGSPMGTYDPNTDWTYTRNGEVVAQGNMLVTLL